jgi:4-diphosphocytidyl-2-C-methyl-D-erythritol kinase
MRWLSPCKLNLWLRVYERSDELHPLESLVVLVDWNDELSVEEATEDKFEISGPLSEGVPDDESNLVWRALELARSTAGIEERFDVQLTKHIPTGAGLGGGSSDAATMLQAFDRLTDRTSASELAPSLGSDIPLFLGRGVQHVLDTGEIINQADSVGEFAVAIAVPPVHLSTPRVYVMWDQMGGPTEPAISGRQIPPSLRGVELFNDLYPAAVAIAPELGDWRADLARRWGCPVFMSGSGSALFSYFSDVEEAQAAADSAPSGVRASMGAELSVDGAYVRSD